MPKPEGCPDPIYDIMTSTWKENPTDRPTFKSLTTLLKQVLESVDEAEPIPSKAENKSESEQLTHSTKLHVHDVVYPYFYFSFLKMQRVGLLALLALEKSEYWYIHVCCPTYILCLPNLVHEHHIYVCMRMHIHSTCTSIIGFQIGARYPLYLVCIEISIYTV